jgi:hypothetical protein
MEALLNALLSTEAVAAVVGAVTTVGLGWLLRPSEERRLLRLRRETSSKLDKSSEFRALDPSRRAELAAQYFGETASSNAHFVATGKGTPVYPELSAWLAQTEHRGLLHDFSGNLHISNFSNSEAEVFYPVPFVRSPFLTVAAIDGSGTWSLEQRPDGFKIRVGSWAGRGSGLMLTWRASGELAK